MAFAGRRVEAERKRERKGGEFQEQREAQREGEEKRYRSLTSLRLYCVTPYGEPGGTERIWPFSRKKAIFETSKS